MSEAKPGSVRDLDAREVRGVDDRGLFVFASPDLDTADTAKPSLKLLRLTGRFLAALRQDSRSKVMAVLRGVTHTGPL